MHKFTLCMLTIIGVCLFGSCTSSALAERDAAAALELGVLLAQDGNHAHAITAYEQGLVSAPGNKQLLYNLATEYLNAGEYAAAEQTARDGAALFPTFTRFAKLRAHALRLLGNPQEAVSVLQQVLSFDTGDSDARLALMHVAAEAGNQGLANTQAFILLAEKQYEQEALDYLSGVDASWKSIQVLGMPTTKPLQGTGK